ncbi:Pre-mRNA splicing factor [Mycena sanguinolenta]|uniref:Pre-mRNA splicing factor n=1 Tax=Mycena sanguinolenta TaxID=230812 RepID=A0A8H7CQ62_9AGAR|nr:Pre-mRNA splicing factor [Mycena sanguinolenta]
MTRALRPRKSQPSYAVAFADDGDEEDESVAGPSRKRRVIVDEDDDSESDFTPEKEASRADPDEGPHSDAGSEVDESLDAEDLTLADDDSVAVPATKSRPAAKRSSKPKIKGPPKVKNFVSEAASMPSLGSGSGIARTSKRQIYILPTPSVHHRHKAAPLHSSTARIERLAAKPVLFGPPVTAPTNNFTYSPAVISRANRAWGFNVGAGPIWEMVEDRGWYKEAAVTKGDVETDANRRPVTHHGLRVKPGLQVLSLEYGNFYQCLGFILTFSSFSEATPYIPTDTVTTEEGNLKPPPPISCAFGPFENQRRVEIAMFESRKNCQLKFIPYLQSGSPCVGESIGVQYTVETDMYLAVAPLSSASHSPDIGVKMKRPAPACIQIWTLSPTKPGLSDATDKGVMRCALVLCVDSGAAQDLKWCPLPSHDSGTFEDGSFSIYVVPEPLDVTPVGHDPSKPVFVKIPEPLLRIELEETACWSFDWANSELVAIGTTHGIIAVYHLGQVLKDSCGLNPPLPSDILPSHYLTVHQSAIRALAWVRAPPSTPSGVPRLDGDPTVICSGGYDGLECLTDIREGHGSVMNRTRDVINSMTFSPFGGGPITIDHENIVKVYSVSPSMLGRGHILMEPQGPIWNLHASDYHPQLAVASADGACSTTNSLRSTRRGGSVPFFVHKIYQLDYNRNTKEFRMLERFFPLEAQDRPTQTKAIRAEKAKGKDNTYVAPTSTGTWPEQVGVQRVVWNCGNGLAASSLLASSTASGLCRVDVVWGRWLNDKVPYGSIQALRMEEGAQGDAMDVDSDDSD